MEKMPDYDCHCHILPGLDDGAADLEESLFLCRWLASHGYREAVCTSHSTRLYPNTEGEVEAAVTVLQRELDREGSSPKPGPGSVCFPGKATTS